MENGGRLERQSASSSASHLLLHWRRSLFLADNRTDGSISGDLSGHTADDMMPLLGVGGRVSSEGILLAHAHFAQRTLGDVLALDVELCTVHAADKTVGEVKRRFRGWVLGKVVVGFELVQIFRGCDDVVSSIVVFEDLLGLSRRSRHSAWL